MLSLAMFFFAGLVGSAFEDWLFAVGYYLSVFMWSLAFSLVDVTRHPIEPSLTAPLPILPSWRGGHLAFLRHQAAARR
jgi:hypothetical protein